MDFANITTVISTKNNDENAQIHHRRTSNHNSNQNTKLKRSPIIMNRMKKLNNRNDSSSNYDEGSSHESKESNAPRTSPSCLSPISILTHLAFGVVTFHIGFAMGGNYGHSFTVSNLENHMSDISNRNDAHHITQMYHQLLSPLFPFTGTTITGIWNDPNNRIQSDTNHTTITPIFPKTLSKVFHGASTVRRENFIQQFDIGVPWNEPKPDATDVLVMYQSAESLPSDYYEKDASSRTNVHSSTADGDGDGGHPTPMSPIRVSYDSADEATTNCHSMKVILIEPNTKHECVALVPQWESFHVQHFLRILPENMTSSRNKNPKPPHFQANYPLRIVSRHDTLSGKTKPRIPIAYQNKKYWLMLLDYLSKLSATLERLKPLAETVVTSSNNFHRSKTIVVMVCNFGQSELFMNFVCSARARNIDVSNILLFATDQDMYRLAQSLHITTFEVQDAFGEMPTGAAKVYGDRVFQGMMLSKVYCVHLISALGYDVLFQDVDVVWYRNPIEYFQSKQSGDFDFYFQDDGAHSTRYTPYSPNSGFYYVRNNERTRYFFEVFMRIGDQIMASGSHQSVMNILLADHSSSTGLRVKVFERDSYLGQEFPGGFHFHKRREFMRTVIEGNRSPYIFHMSWTENKNNKQKFYQQLGDWFVNDQCINKKHEELEISEDEHFSSHCCSTTPIMKCHYSDKPSKTSCKKSPKIDKRGKSFW